jgi:hypothetical protein
MSAIAHVVRTDLRQFRWLIVLWLLLIAADTAVAAMRPSLSTDMRLYANAGMIAGLLWSALQIGMLLMVPLVVQAHPAVGTDAFWMTRPFPPRAVFAAKALLLAALTVALPALARLALMLWAHVPAGRALGVALDMVISSTAWLAVLIAGAAVTINLPRFALLCGGVFVAFVVIITVEIMRVQMDESVGGYAMVAVSGQPVLPPADDPTQGVLFLLSVALAGFALGALQYRTRRRLVSVPAAAGGLMLAALAIPHWPLPLLKIRPALPAWSGQGTALQLRAATPVLEMAPAMGGFDAGHAIRTAGTTAILSGIEPGWVPQLRLLDASLTLDGGATLSTRNRGYQSTPQIEGVPDSPGRAVGRQVLGVEQVFSAMGPRLDPVTALVVPARSATMTLPAHGRYLGHFAVQLTHWEPVAALPLRAGSSYRDAGFRFEIQEVEAGPGTALSVRAREWRATSSFDRLPMITYGFYVRNARQSRAMEGRESEPFGDFSVGLPFVMGSSGPSRFMLRSAVVAFPPYVPADQKIDWDPAWYADAELVIVRMTEAGSVLRSLDMPSVAVVEKR